MVIALSVALLLVVVNCAASIYVGRAPVYGLRQKIAQITVIWVIPILGAAFVSYFLYCDRRAIAYPPSEGSDSSITEGEAIRHAMATNELRGR